MHVGAQRPPDRDRLRALVEDGRRRKEIELGRHLSYRNIASGLRHADGKPFSENVINNWFDKKKATKPAYDTLVAIATYFGDDEQPWLEAGGFGPKDQRAMTPPQQRLLHMMHGRPLEEQSALVRLFEAVDDITRIKLRILAEQEREVQQRVVDTVRTKPTLLLDGPH